MTMKNKDRYNLNTIDYYVQDENTIIIYKLGVRNEIVDTFETFFDEPHFRAFMRWLED